MVSDDLWSIGELAGQAGVTVKTVRFYSDRGLLPEAARSSGGHRRYGPPALDRLRLIRSLRSLDLPVPEVGRILAAEDASGGALEDAVARQLRELGSQLAALRWQEAALRLVHDATPEERPGLLRLVGAVPAPPGSDALARFWRRVLPARLPAPLLSSILESAVPQPPADPTPAQVLAFARLHVLVGGVQFGKEQCRPASRMPDDGFRPAVLYAGLGEAYALASDDLRGRRPPQEGGSLDCFVAAHAQARGARDTPAFRRGLAGMLAQTADPVVERYWDLTGELLSPPSGPAEPTLGSAHTWLYAALKTQVRAAAL
ncbi:MerR family transcriptional regulator [Kitasatospora sp. NE20-6]|uniref:helix-turn-helix domain-containing protein n=1 Tax=Kitasatospora sp. NE20-6 TaxID=2859066 RepID=UPI0034DCBD5E